MTVADQGEARDAVFTLVQDALDDSTEPGGYVGDWPPPIIYADNPDEAPATGPYIEVALQHQRGGQVAIGSSGTTRFRAWARLTVTLYTPLGDGLTLSDYLANILVVALENGSTPDRVYFRSVRSVEDGLEGTRQKARVIAEVDYDRIH